MSNPTISNVIVQNPVAALVTPEVRRLFGELMKAERGLEFTKMAIRGFTMREHVDQHCPLEVDDVARLSTQCYTREETDAWLFGYRFVDPPPGEDALRTWEGGAR